MDPADWDTIRLQTRTYYDLLGEGCMEGPWESPYTYVEAEAVLDEESLGKIGLRKKGLIGSASETRPSLRIDTNHYVEDQFFYGLEHLVFNNNNQDPGSLRTCMAHDLFADAGLVAPRCTLSEVIVNGESLGIYSFNEAIEPELVERVLGAEPESMYEGALSDFREGWIVTFEEETDSSDRHELEAVAEALKGDDAGLLDRLEPLVDIDAYMTFWAAEVLAGHWDGYNGNTNNFYVYTDPETGLLKFIASGPDAAFDSRTPFGQGQPVWVTTNSALSNRLIQHSEGKALYEAELTRLLDEVWKGEERLAQLDSLAALLEPYSSSSMRRGNSTTRAVIENKESDLRESLGDRISAPELRDPFCWSNIGTVTVDFSTTWGSYPNGDLFGGGTVVSSYTISGVDYPTSADGASIGNYQDDYLIWLTISTIAQDTYLAPYVVFKHELLMPGSELTLDGHMASAALMYMDPSTNGQWVLAAYLAEGALYLEEADDAGGAVVSGRLEAGVMGSE